MKKNWKTGLGFFSVILAVFGVLDWYGWDQLIVSKEVHSGLTKAQSGLKTAAQAPLSPLGGGAPLAKVSKPVPNRGVASTQSPNEAGANEANSGIFREPRIETFESAPVVSASETVPDQEGRFTRVRVLKTGMKYPLVRVEEKWVRDFATGQDQVTHRVEMIADHLILKLDPGYTAEDLVRVVVPLGFEVRATISGGRAYLVSFNGHEPMALEKAAAQLKATQGISYSEPDYIVHAN